LKTAHWLVVVGSCMLFITAALHGSGYIALSGMAEKSNADKLAVEAFKALWLVFSVHCAALGAIFIVASRTPGGRRTVLLGALVPAADTVLLLHFLGVFVGTIALALCLLIGGFLLPRNAQA
jgi:hypothetical protein